MGKERFSGNPTVEKVEKNELEVINEEFAYERIREIISEIKEKLANNGKYNADGHWAAAVGLGSQPSHDFGYKVILAILEEKGWSTNTFPAE